MSAPQVDGEPTALPRELVERVLAAFGLPAAPTPDEDGLLQIYGAWCRHVPFDNVRKLLHLRAGDHGRLPGDDARDFLEFWLRDGVGGTCWAGNGALHALLRALGFEARRGLATMVTSPRVPPNHGTVVVGLEERQFLVDASILHGAPLPLDETTETAIGHGAWGVRCARRDGRWHVRWRPLHMPAGLDCRLERLGITAQGFRERHEASRAWSPFNFALYVRANRGQCALGVAFGQQVEFDSSGAVSQTVPTPAQRIEWLAERIGIRPALLARLPPDLPTPPPPAPAPADGPDRG